ncbi:MAG: hypothetical protein JWO43_136 [Candidatus Adlerbacteria bacterium]|nr:hypothetical protein [Candidatus Adlerbacteria bacterium]
MWTNPQYQQAKVLSAQAAQYDDALTKAKELRSLREDLMKKRNTFLPDDLAKLQKVLPDNVDNIRLIIDINNIARRHSLSISEVRTGDAASTNAQSQSATAVGGAGQALGSVELGVTINASYENFVPFLIDLEHSQRILDVKSITYKTAPGSSISSVEITFRTYWLH